MERTACFQGTCLLLNSTAKCHQVTSWGCTCFAKCGTACANGHEESEWSPTTSLIRLFCCPYEQAAGRSLKEMCRSCSLAWTKCCSSRRNPDEAMSHDGNFDQSVSGRVSLEKAPCMRTFPHRSEPGGLRNPQTSAQLSGIDPGPHNGGGPGGAGKAQSVKASSTVLRLFLLRHRHAVPLRSTATKSTS